MFRYRWQMQADHPGVGMMRAKQMPRRPAPAASPVLRAVRAGDEISIPVEGGFARRSAPSDGVIIELAERDVFVPVAALLEALQLLGHGTR
jgi:hypothetical protein